MTISGLAMKESVSGLPSLRRGKLRLKELMIELRGFGCAVCALPPVTSGRVARSSRCHWPMQGPQALASTLPPICSSVSSCPSRARVARTCSEPGVIMKFVCIFAPWSIACCATAAAREMSSYDEFVQEPTRAAESRSG